MPPLARPFPRFIADTAQESRPYGRWEERLSEAFVAACGDLAAEAGTQVDAGRMRNILALFSLQFDEPAAMRTDIAGRAVYLALSAEDGVVRMKPQNLLLNLPLHEA